MIVERLSVEQMLVLVAVKQNRGTRLMKRSATKPAFVAVMAYQ